VVDDRARDLFRRLVDRAVRGAALRGALAARDRRRARPRDRSGRPGDAAAVARRGLDHGDHGDPVRLLLLALSDKTGDLRGPRDALGTTSLALTSRPKK